MSETPQLLRLRIAYALSGCSALILQVVWFRKISLFLGTSSEAASVTLAVFMLGLACGSYLARPVLSLTKNPFALLAGVELTIGVYGAFSIFVLNAMGAAYGQWVTGPLAIDASRHLSLRTLACSVGLIVPTTLMGLTFPVLLQAVGLGREHAGRISALLYAANTAGAALGALATGFLLIAAFGLTGSAFVAASLNVAAAALILMHARVASTVAPLSASEDAARAPSSAASRRRRLLLALVFFVAGCSTFAIETLWTRWLMFLMGGNSVSVFALILFGFLGGIQFGSRRMARTVDALADPLATLGVALALVGVTTLVASIALGGVPILMDATSLDGGFRHGLITFVVVLFVLVPSALGGATVSLAARELVHRHGKSGADVGRYYAINVLGCIVGSLAAGFLLLPQLGLRMGIAAVASMDVAAGLACSVMVGARRLPMTIGLAVSAAGLAAVLYFLPPPILLKLDRSTQALVYYSEDSDASVAVARNTQSQDITLLVNGDPQAGSGPDREAHLRFLGHLPALFTGELNDALVIGLGAGFTTGSVLAHPFVRVTQVELSHAIPMASRYFEDLTDHPLDDPRLRVRFDDGRNVLLTTEQLFDVITTDPVDPNDAGATSLYAKEYFELVRRRLRPGGVAAQWLPLMSDLSDYRTLVRTFQSVFPASYLWFARNTTVVIGFRDSPRLSRHEVEDRLKSARVAQAFARLDIHRLDELLACLLGDGEQLAQAIGPGSLNTDEFPIIEYSRAGRINPSLFARTIVSPLLPVRERSVASLFRAVGR